MINEYGISDEGVLSLPSQVEGFPILVDYGGNESILSPFRERRGRDVSTGSEFTLFDYDIKAATDVTLKNTTTVALNTTGGKHYYTVTLGSALICNRFEVIGQPVNVASIIVEVSTDGNSWTQLTTTNIELDTVDTHIEFLNTTAYQYYRFSTVDTQPTITTTDISLFLNSTTFQIKLGSEADSAFAGNARMFITDPAYANGTELEQPAEWIRQQSEGLLAAGGKMVIIDNGFVRVMFDGRLEGGKLEVLGYISNTGESGWRSLITSADDWKDVSLKRVTRNRPDSIKARFSHRDRNGVVSEFEVTVSKGQQMAQFEIVSWGSGAIANQFFTNQDDLFTQVFTLDEGVIDVNTASSKTLDTTTENWILMHKPAAVSDVVLSSTHKNAFKIELVIKVFGMGSAPMASQSMGSF